LLIAESSPNLTSMPLPEVTTNKKAAQRRSQRLLLRVPVLVERSARGGQARQEDTETLAVNAHGALILLDPPIEDGEHLSLTNKKTGEMQACRVVYLGPVESGRTQAGIEFTNPSPQFWRIAFPPEDWASYGKDTRPPAKI
jgi:hypothetical protein